MAVTATGIRSGSPMYNFGTFNPLVSLAPEEEDVPFSLAQRINMSSAFASGIMGAGGQLQQGNALQRQSVFRAAQLQQNAEIMRRQASEIESAAAVAIQQRSESTEQLVGMQIAQTAGAGIVVNQDTALDEVARSYRDGTLDKLTLAKNAERQAQAARIQASQFDDSATLTIAAGDDAKKASRMSALTTLIGTAGSVASKWYSFNKYNTEGIA